MKAPNLEDHLQLAGSTKYVDYIVKNKDIEYSIEIAKQFAALMKDYTMLFPNNDAFPLPYVVRIDDKGVTTQLVIYTKEAEDTNKLQEAINERFNK